jgi:PAS domain S-box-containing protein
MPNETIQLWLENYRRCEREGRPARFEFSPSAGAVWSVIVSFIGQVDDRSRFSYVAEDVTDERRIAAGLRASEELFRGIVESANEGIWVVDENGRTAYVNARMAAMLGYKPAEVAGRRTFDFIAPEDWERARAHRAEIKEGRPSRSRAGYRLIRKDGTTVDVEMSGSRLLDGQGRFAGGVGMFTDVSARKEADRVLRRHTRHLAILSEIAMELLSLTGAQDIVRAAFSRLSSELDVEVFCCFRVAPENPGELLLEASAGLPFNAAQGLPRLAFGQGIAGIVAERRDSITVSDVQSRQDERTSLIRSIGLQAYTCHPLIANGRLFGVLSFGSRMRKTFEPDELTLMRTACNQVAAALERLRLGEQTSFQARLLDEVRSAVVATDTGGCVRYWSRHAVTTLGWQASEVVGRRLLELVAPEASRPAAEVLIAEIRRTGYWEGEFELQRKGGAVFPAMVTVAAIHEAGEQPAGHIFLATDISGPKALEERIRHSQHIESIGRLAGGVAHNLNNILVGIMGYASMVADELPADSPHKDALNAVITSSRRAAELTSQLLAYSGQGRFVLRRTSLTRIVHDLEGLIRSSIPRNIHLNYRLAEELPLVDADVNQVRQIVMGLVLNASEAIGGADGLIGIETGVLRLDDHAAAPLQKQNPWFTSGEYVALTVRDTGHGMDQETMERIFEPFFTTRFTGRGLGLAAVAGIARSYRGAVSVQSSLGAGSVFQVLLPPDSNVTGDHGEAAAQSGGSVLIVDDEPGVLQVAQAVLQRHGVRTLAALDGQEGVKMFERHADEVRLVIMDVAMPRLDGARSAAAIKAVRPGVPVVLSSGYPETEVRRGLENLDIAGFLQKPYAAQNLLAMVRKFVGI